VAARARSSRHEQSARRADHEPHPADDARERHGGGGDEGGADDDRESAASHVQAQRARLRPRVIAKRSMRQRRQDERREADRDEGTATAEVGRERPAEAPQQPEGDGGELVVGIGHSTFTSTDPGAEERAHDHALEDASDGVAPV